MPINFFAPACQEQPISVPIFGICDDRLGGKAFTNVHEPEIWVATVENPGCLLVQLTAIDHCLPMLRADQSMDNRCDAMLTYSENLVFIELKVVGKQWVKEAIAQLEATIQHFIASHDPSLFSKKRAFACNRRHPRFAEMDMEKKQRFYHAYRFRLHIGATIKI